LTISTISWTAPVFSGVCTPCTLSLITCPWRLRRPEAGVWVAAPYRMSKFGAREQYDMGRWVAEVDRPLARNWPGDSAAVRPT
jgi:hypothetical protein